MSVWVCVNFLFLVRKTAKPLNISSMPGCEKLTEREKEVKTTSSYWAMMVNAW